MRDGPTDRPNNGLTNGWTNPLIKMHPDCTNFWDTVGFGDTVGFRGSGGGGGGGVGGGGRGGCGGSYNRDGDSDVDDRWLSVWFLKVVVVFKHFILLRRQHGSGGSGNGDDDSGVAV